MENNNGINQQSGGDFEKVGAGWGKTAKDGKFFISAVLEKGCEPGARIFIKENKFKETDKHPDFIISQLKKNSGV